MSALPNHIPQQLNLGPLETEIMEILWQHGTATTVRAIHEQILSDPDRELAYASVTTVLNRLVQKGWLKRHRHGKAFLWKPRLSQAEAQLLRAHHQFKQFLAVGNAEIVAAFVDSLDAASLEQLDAIAQKIQAVRQQREQP
jgi:predicted transcriptional regulator